MEWMYQLAQRERDDPWRHHNLALLAVYARQRWAILNPYRSFDCFDSILLFACGYLTSQARRVPQDPTGNYESPIGRH